jgi:hypothetical protein
MARRRKTQFAPPPEIPAAAGPLEEAADPVGPETAPPAESVTPLDDGAALGYPYPVDAVGQVTTLRDFGSHRICTDQTGRKLRQYRE